MPFGHRPSSFLCLLARISPKINSSPTKTNSESMTILNQSSNSSLQPLFIALGVGLVVLLIAMVLVIVACRKSRVPISRKRPKQRQQQQPDPGLMAKHTCDLRTSFWSTGRQTSESSSWMEKKHQQHRQQQPCKACHSHDINSPSKMAVSCDPCHAESCRCGVPSSISSTGHNTGLDHSCSTVGGGGISGCVPLVELQNSFHPCCNSSGPCAGHSPNPRLPLGSCGLSALSGINEGFPVPLDNIQYVVGLHTNELTKGLLTYPDQRSLSKSNSSSSGVGVNSAQMTVYGSPYPLGTALGSPAQAGARIDSVAYSTAHKESPMAESSSGRGCDGGSGTSEPSETFHFTCPRSRPSCHAISNPLTNRQLMNYLPIPGSVMPMNASDYMSRVSSQCGIGSTSYDATSARSLVSVVSRPGRTDTSPRPSFRSSTSTERNLTTPPGYLPKIGTDRTLGLDYVTEHPNSRETYDQVPAYHQVLESELCSQTTLHRPPSQRGHYSILPSMEPESISDAHAPISFDQGSSESLTVPLLEPPSNFRSPTKLLNSSGTTDYIGLDAEDDLSNLQSNQKLADMIIHKTNRTTDVGDGVEQPPPPIAPLRVFANSSNLIGLGKDSCYFSAR
ncbi:hypothetical protein D915_011037 [Fasciola hepatica]|uniref:Uncharacterized protein n=1 Tax=Fasciola hepatica TaxID=6192 RepID=A0A4E0R8I2_FASHE|nr:hypothetical protein D915_011037 [Fasciola hepatica]